MAVLLAYQLISVPATKAALGEVVQGHLLMQIGIQCLFIGYFFLNILSIVKSWVMKYLAGEKPVADIDSDMMWQDDSRIAEKIDFEDVRKSI